MKRSSVRTLFLVTVAIVLLAGAAYKGQGRLYIMWNKMMFATGDLPVQTLEQALTLAQNENKPVLAYFGAYWCPYCSKFDRQVLKQTTVSDYIKDHYVFARVDSEADNFAALRHRYGVVSFPTLLILNSTGELVRQLPPSFDPDEFLQAL